MPIQAGGNLPRQRGTWDNVYDLADASETEPPYNTGGTYTPLWRLNPVPWWPKAQPDIPKPGQPPQTSPSGGSASTTGGVAGRVAGWAGAASGGIALARQLQSLIRPYDPYSQQNAQKLNSFLSTAYPGTNPWEQLGSAAGGAATGIGGAQTNRDALREQAGQARMRLQMELENKLQVTKYQGWASILSSMAQARPERHGSQAEMFNHILSAASRQFQTDNGATVDQQTRIGQLNAQRQKLKQELVDIQTRQRSEQNEREATRIKRQLAELEQNIRPLELRNRERQTNVSAFRATTDRMRVPIEQQKADASTLGSKASMVGARAQEKAIPIRLQQADIAHARQVLAEWATRRGGHVQGSIRGVNEVLGDMLSGDLSLAAGAIGATTIGAIMGRLRIPVSLRSIVGRALLHRKAMRLPPALRKSLYERHGFSYDQGKVKRIR